MDQDMDRDMDRDKMSRLSFEVSNCDLKLGITICDTKINQ